MQKALKNISQFIKRAHFTTIQYLVCREWNVQFNTIISRSGKNITHQKSLVLYSALVPAFNAI